MMTREEALTHLRQGLSRIAYWDGGTCVCDHCPSCEARALLIQAEPGGDLGVALEAEKPLAVGYVHRDTLADYQEDIRKEGLDFHRTKTSAWDLPVIILPTDGLCAFCRGLGYIVNPDDLKRVPCYCQEPQEEEAAP